MGNFYDQPMSREQFVQQYLASQNQQSSQTPTATPNATPQTANPTNSLTSMLMMNQILNGGKKAAADTAATTASSSPGILDSISSIFGGGSGEAANASYNIPSSYLPSVGGSSSAEAISSTAPGFAPSLGAVGPLPLAAIAGATYLGGKSAYNMLKGKEDKSIPGYIGRGSLAIATGGLSEVGKGLGLWGRKSTKQLEKERWGKLSKSNIPNAEAAYQANHGGGDTWSSGKYAGQKWSFDKALDLAKGDPTHFQHVYGNYDTFGKDWEGYSDQQQKAIVSQLANQNLYNSSKGDVFISDKAKAQSIRDQVLSGNTGGFDSTKTMPQQPKIGWKMANGKTYMGPGVYR